jgi:hypothetical protein
MKDGDSLSQFHVQIAQAVVVLFLILLIQMKLGDGTITFSPTVLVVLQDRELRWLGRVFIPGLFDGEHSFVIEPLSENQVLLVQSEAFNGLLIPFSGSLLEGTKLNFEVINQALKKRVEETN